MNRHAFLRFIPLLLSLALLSSACAPPAAARDHLSFLKTDFIATLSATVSDRSYALTLTHTADRLLLETSEPIPLCFAKQGETVTLLEGSTEIPLPAPVCGIPLLFTLLGITRQELVSVKTLRHPSGTCLLAEYALPEGTVRLTLDQKTLIPRRIEGQLADQTLRMDLLTYQPI